MKTLLLSILFSTTAMATDYVSKVDKVVAMNDLVAVKIKNSVQKTQCSTKRLTKSGNYKRLAVKINKINTMVSSVSKEFSVNPCVILSMIAQESSFDPDAVSNKKKAKINPKVVQARGLMQVIPSTKIYIISKMGYNYNMLFTRYLSSGLSGKEVESIILGTSYFKSLMKRFKNNTKTAVIAYNEGETKVQNWIDNGIAFGQNHNHYKKVNENFVLVSLN